MIKIIALTDGDGKPFCQVQASVFGNFAVHRQVWKTDMPATADQLVKPRGEFQITHILTGAVALNVSALERLWNSYYKPNVYKKTLIEIAKKMDALPEWQFQTIAEFNKKAKQLGESRKAIVAEFKPASIF